MTPVDIEKLKELLQRATPGPWDDRLWDDCIVTAEHRVDNLIACSPVQDRFPSSAVGWINNAALIVAAVNSLPALIAKAERVDAMEVALTEAATTFDQFAATLREHNPVAMAQEIAVAELAAAEARNALSPKESE